MRASPLVRILFAVTFFQILIPGKIVTDAILSGVQVYPGEIKSLVFLASVYSEKRFPLDSRVRICGGNLIDPNWVLTAAHCFYDYSGNFIAEHDWVASFGVTRIGNTIQGLYIDITNFVNNNKSWLPVQRRISKIVLYPQYSWNDYTTHDIALLLLNEPVPVNGLTIDIMPLPYSFHEQIIPRGTKCGCAGWGCQFYGGELSLRALRGTFIVRVNSNCNGFEGNMTDLKICAGYADGVFSICMGDSGSPLLCYLNGKYVLAGVASYSSKADPQNEPNVFTRVAPYLDWLTTVMREVTPY